MQDGEGCGCSLTTAHLKPILIPAMKRHEGGMESGLVTEPNLQTLSGKRSKRVVLDF